jgi:hypothetical protein
VGHLLTECNFAEAVCDQIIQRIQAHHTLSPFQKGGVSDWIELAGSKQQQQHDAGIILSFRWQLWKERNRRIFQQKEASFLQVSELIKSDIAELPQTALLHG